MAKWDLSKLPEGRKPLPDEWFAERAQMQERIKQLEERLEAATDDAKEAEAYAGELEANLAKAVEALQGLVPILCEGFEDGCGKLSRHDCAACEGYATLAELTGGKDE